MRVLVTGREGQIVRALFERAENVPEVKLISVGRPELDLTEPGSAAAAVRRIAPDVVISAAAYTAVDKAEEEPDLADRVNGEAPGELAAAAGEIDAPIIHLSTDYVFDGRKAEPYQEEDTVGPLGAYGRSKLLGEERVRAVNPQHMILRTAWVYSPFGKNFVKTMMKLAESGEDVNVVADQHGSPTSALDVADGLLTVLANWSGGCRSGLGETFHLAGTGATDWCGFAAHIFKTCARLGLPSATARPITTAEYQTKAARPANSRLNSSRFHERFGFRAPAWQLSTDVVIARIAVDQARAGRA